MPALLVERIEARSPVSGLRAGFSDELLGR
jgi:hypothetical protein